MSTDIQKSRWSFGRFIKYGVLAILVFAVVSVAWFFWMVTGGVFSTSSFDSSIWHAKQTNQTDMTCFRGGMANDIKKRLLKPGMPRGEVEAILGTPESKSTDVAEYTLGMCSGIDFDSLNVYFSEQGRVIKVAIVQH